MKKYLYGFLVVLAALLTLSTDAAAQTPVGPTARVQWDQGLEASAAQAQALRYDARVDGGTPVQLTGVACAGTAPPWVCDAALPAMVTGQHVVDIRAVRVLESGSLFSTFSAPLSLLMQAVPATPANVRLLTVP